jgi:diguanylate cyclase (GGDEF)-like protein
MIELSRELQEKLAVLSGDFKRQLPERFRELDSALLSLRGDVQHERLRDFRLLVHKLAGSGATFGLEALSMEAKELEVFLESLIDSDTLPDEKALGCIGDTLVSLRALCGGCDGAEEVAGLEELGELEELEQQEVLVNETELGRSGRERSIIHLVDPRGIIASDVAGQLSIYGYEVEELDDIQAVKVSLECGSRRLLIVSTESLIHDAALSAKLTLMKSRYSSLLGIIFVSARDDFEIRLLAVRAGGDAFFLLPLDIGRLVDRIDALNARFEVAPYHVLIVDDDRDQVAYYAFLFQQAGMVTSVASDPMKVLSILVESKPELILMDLYMPGCGGIELAALLRQHEAFIGIPILFLSFEGNRDRQMEALFRGGDEFLQKPIKPEQLIQLVRTRAERNRSIRYFMERDSLTGLLNHTNLKEQLTREVLRASRSGTSLAYAMIDADHFKRVNDTWGHLTGDRVLKNLSRLLQDRLRRTDIIGRYGGEEFGIILLNTSLEDAARIMNEIRENFSRVLHQVDDKEFGVTFSCGISGYPRCADAAEINVCADKALYEAKETGRNRVVIYK